MPKDKARINTKLYAKVQEVDKTAIMKHLAIINVSRRHKHLGVEKLRAGQVCQKHADGDGQKQQRLITAHNCKIHQHA